MREKIHKHSFSGKREREREGERRGRPEEFIIDIHSIRPEPGCT